MTISSGNETPPSWRPRHILGEDPEDRHPCLSAASTPPGTDAGPEPVPGRVPDTRDKETATPLPPSRLVPVRNSPAVALPAAIMPRLQPHNSDGMRLGFRLW